MKKQNTLAREFLRRLGYGDVSLRSLYTIDKRYNDGSCRSVIVSNGDFIYNLGFDAGAYNNKETLRWLANLEKDCQITNSTIDFL